MQRLPISVVINTYQADQYLDLVLQAVADYASEIVVCDMHSTDKTVAIAESFGAKVVYHEHVGYAAPARKFAIEQATNEWILLLDADEVVPPGFWKAFAQMIDENKSDIVHFSWTNYMFGQAMTVGGFDPAQETHMRFFKKSAVECTGVIHSSVVAKPGVRHWTIPYDPKLSIQHFTYLSAENFISKSNRYTTLESQQPKFTQKLTGFNILRKVVRDFIKRYWLKKGYKLGWQGLSISLLMLANDAMLYSKVLEQKNGSNAEKVLEKHRAIAQQVLK
ncbi:MAG: glycosyltransferase family 2 protein [Fimbriimonadaceae bacterium]|nr:MAG: glycosyltransferase family 2 protein [Fimbriimonadaceae bacterium]